MTKTLIEQLLDVRGTPDVREEKMRRLIDLYSQPLIKRIKGGKISFENVKGDFSLVEYPNDIFGTIKESNFTVDDLVHYGKYINKAVTITEFAKQKYLWKE